MIRCYHCGTDNLDGTEFCDECGMKLTRPAPPPPSLTSTFAPAPDATVGPPTIPSLPPQPVTGVTRTFVPPKKPLGGKARRYLEKLFRSRRIGFGTAVETPSYPPFAIYSDKCEVTVPLLQSFRFVHEPIGFTSGAQFVGRRNEMESLAERILFSEGGSFLVTGYRGVGKTSFVNQVIRKLEEALPWARPLLGKTEIVDIYLNVARPVQPSEIMHHIIRRLYDRLVEKGIYLLLDQNLRQALALAYHRTSVNMARKLAESTERNFGFNEASVGGEWMKAAVKMSWNSKRSRTQNYEISFLGYDDKAAEHDIITISRRLAVGYVKPVTRWGRLKLPFNSARPDRVRLKIVFVFDELDKLEEFTPKGAEDGGDQKPVIDQILGALKNLFTTSGVTFVFVAGKDLQERWLEDVGKGDSVYESVFSYDKYLPCLWTDVDSICDGLVNRSQALSFYEGQVFNAFKKYLAYKGRGIPRRIIRTFNEYVEWNGAQPALAFTRQNVRKIRFFAGLQDVLDASQNTLFGESHEEVPGTQSDKRRLGVYYLIDWVLRQAASEFTLKDVLSASKRLSVKIALAEEIAPRVAEDIIRILLGADYIQAPQKPLDRVLIGDANIEEEKRYRVSPRRLVEMGGLTPDVEGDLSLGLPSDGIFGDGDRLPTSIGKYKIIREIGRGGMGVVYQAIDNHSGRNVAIKAMDEQMAANTGLQARFEREAMIMNELHHPNVVRLYDWGRENGRLYISMEYLDGVTLEEVIKRQGRLGLDLTVAIARPVVEAAHYVHQKGFVRNDIKPNNIMLTTAGRVCLLDFGISRPASPKPELQVKVDTKTQEIIGTPQFMGPEQFERHTVDERSDIYSLGVVLYKMLTGQYPFDGSAYEVMHAHLVQTPDPPSRRVPLPPAIDGVILKCLEKDPGKRFQTMVELAEALSSAAGDLPPVDLKSVVSMVREEAKEIEQMDRMHTLEPVDTPAPAMPRAAPIEAPTGFTPESPAPPPPQSVVEEEPAITMAAAPLKAPLYETGGPTPSDPRPRIALLRGRASDVDWRLTSLETGYLLEKKTSVGRSSENDIVLRDAKVSRYHAEFTVDGESWFIEDFNSGLGTFVRGEKIITRQLLRDGDEIQIGDFVFIFNYAKANHGRS